MSLDKVGMHSSPRFDYDMISHDEKEATHYIEEALASLEQRLLEFKHSLSLARFADSQRELCFEESKRLSTVLFDFSASREASHKARSLSADNDEKRQEATNWLQMAIRQGAIAAYQFWMNTQSINNHLGLCPKLTSKIDLPQKKAAAVTFNKAFPSIASVRLSAAHSGEMGLSKTDVSKHAVRYHDGDSSGSDELLSIFMGGSYVIDNGKFSYEAGVKGKLVSYDLSDDTLLALSSVTRHYWACFSPVECWSSKTSREMML